jgi:hypothetical protein
LGAAGWTLFGQSGGDIQLRDDGFSIHANIPRGKKIRYAYTQSGRGRQFGELEYQPGPTGHFVYTGARPDSAEIMGVRDSGDDFDDSSRHDDRPRSGLFGSTSSSSRPTRRNPSAY